MNLRDRSNVLPTRIPPCYHRAILDPLSCQAQDTCDCPRHQSRPCAAPIHAAGSTWPMSRASVPGRPCAASCDSPPCLTMQTSASPFEPADGLSSLRLADVCRVLLWREA